MPQVISTVPACLKALVAAAKRAVPPRTINRQAVPVTVVLGQPSRHQIDADDIICIAFTGEPAEAAVNSTRSQQQAATTPDRESYDVTCLASSWQGNDDDPEAVLDRTYEMVNALAAALAADTTLGGVAGRCRISTDALAQAQTERGACTVVRFTVHVEAFTRR